MRRWTSSLVRVVSGKQDSERKKNILKNKTSAKQIQFILLLEKFI